MPLNAQNQKDLLRVLPQRASSHTHQAALRDTSMHACRRDLISWTIAGIGTMIHPGVGDMIMIITEQLTTQRTKLEATVAWTGSCQQNQLRMTNSVIHPIAMGVFPASRLIQSDPGVFGHLTHFKVAPNRNVDLEKDQAGRAPVPRHILTVWI